MDHKIIPVDESDIDLAERVVAELDEIRVAISADAWTLSEALREWRRSKGDAARRAAAAAEVSAVLRVIRAEVLPAA